MTSLHRTALGVLLAVLAPACVRAEPDPDPVALLRGVRQAREGVHGAFRMTSTLTQTRGGKTESSPEPVQYEVRFDRDKRKFTQRQITLMINPPNQEEKSRRLAALNNDVRAAAAAGVGELVHIVQRSVHDGSQLVDYADEAGQAAIRNDTKGAPYLCFDVRTLGVCRYPSVYGTLDQALGLTPDYVVSLIGREEVAGRPAWHVQAVHRSGSVRHYWVEPIDGFRVPKFAYLDPADGSSTRCEVVSEYDGAALPSRVVTRETWGGAKSEAVYTISGLDLGVEPDAAEFGLAGLDLPPGTRVTDERISRVAGYWNGSGLSESSREALTLAAADIANPPAERRRVWRNTVLAAAAVVIVVGAVVVYRRRARGAVA
ncbi:MAG: hypothetical protein K2X82_02495 [Gemmataceae bacterium]|nr:hypothetical protein [Gemmataceae bacterium]